MDRPPYYQRPQRVHSHSGSEQWRNASNFRGSSSWTNNGYNNHSDFSRRRLSNSEDPSQSQLPRLMEQLTAPKVISEDTRSAIRDLLEGQHNFNQQLLATTTTNYTKKVSPFPLPLPNSPMPQELTKLQKNLCCAFCKRFPFTPPWTCEGGHTICDRCIATFAEKSTSCPVDFSCCAKVHPNCLLSMDEYFGDKKFYCHHFGCSDTVIGALFEKHLKDCQWGPASVTCHIEDCLRSMQKSNYSHHLLQHSDSLVSGIQKEVKIDCLPHMEQVEVELCSQFECFGDKFALFKVEAVGVVRLCCFLVSGSGNEDKFRVKGSVVYRGIPLLEEEVKVHPMTKMMSDVVLLGECLVLKRDPMQRRLVVNEGSSSWWPVMVSIQCLDPSLKAESKSTTTTERQQQRPTADIVDRQMTTAPIQPQQRPVLPVAPQTANEYMRQVPQQPVVVPIRPAVQPTPTVVPSQQTAPVQPVVAPIRQADQVQPTPTVAPIRQTPVEPVVVRQEREITVTPPVQVTSLDCVDDSGSRSTPPIRPAQVSMPLIITDPLSPEEQIVVEFEPDLLTLPLHPKTKLKPTPPALQNYQETPTTLEELLKAKSYLNAKLIHNREYRQWYQETSDLYNDTVAVVLARRKQRYEFDASAQVQQ